MRFKAREVGGGDVLRCTAMEPIGLRNVEALQICLSHYLFTISYMNKADIVDKVHGILGSTKADAERAVETVIDCIVSSLKSGEEVSIAGLGIFATKARPARQGRNPRTGETIHIAATRTAKFRPAKALKDAVK